MGMSLGDDDDDDDCGHPGTSLLVGMSNIYTHLYEIGNFSL